MNAWDPAPAGGDETPGTTLGARAQLSSALARAADEIRLLLLRNADAKARDEEDRRRLDRLEARAAARGEAALRESGRNLARAEARWRLKRDELRRRATPPPVPALVEGGGAVAPSRETDTGWEGDPVAEEAIALIEGAPLDDAAGIRVMRREMARRLHPDRHGARYADLLAWANSVLDWASDRLDAGPA